MMNIKKRNFIVTALGSLMVMGTLISPVNAMTANVAPLILSDSAQIESSDIISIELSDFEDMVNLFDKKPTTEDKNQMKKYFDEASKLDKDGKYEQSTKIWEKFDKIFEKYIDFSKCISIEATEIDQNNLSKDTSFDIKNISDKEMSSIMFEIEETIKLK